MAKINRLHQPFAFNDTYFIFDDFRDYVDGTGWTATLTDSGTAAVGDAAGGIITLTASDGSVADNDEAYLESDNETFLVADNKPIEFCGYVQFTEANTDDANIFVGLASAVAANLLVDDGAGPRASGQIVGFYKVDGGTVWHLYSRNGSSSTDTTTTITAGGASYQKLEFHINNEGDGGTNVRITFMIDDKEVIDPNTGRPYVHTMAIASSTEMQVGLGVKNGGANNQTLLIDYVYAAQKR